MHAACHIHTYMHTHIHIHTHTHTYTHTQTNRSYVHTHWRKKKLHDSLSKISIHTHIHSYIHPRVYSAYILHIHCIFHIAQYYCVFLSHLTTIACFCYIFACFYIASAHTHITPATVNLYMERSYTICATQRAKPVPLFFLEFDWWRPLLGGPTSGAYVPIPNMKLTKSYRQNFKAGRPYGREILHTHRTPATIKLCVQRSYTICGI